MDQQRQAELYQRLRLYADAGFTLTPLSAEGAGKIPAKMDWANAKYDLDPKDSSYSHNFGVVLQEDDIIVDVDPRNFKNRIDSLDALEQDLGWPLRDKCVFKVRTGGGGLHLYFKKDPTLKIKETNEKYPGIELKQKGRQVVGAGCWNRETGGLYTPASTNKPLSEITQITPDIAELFKPKMAAVKGEDLETYDDSEQAVSRAKAVLAMHPPAIEGDNGDATTFQAACIIRDYGLSPEKALELLCEYNERCEPPWNVDELDIKLKNAYRYGQNPLGYESPQASFDAIEEEKEPEDLLGLFDAPVEVEDDIDLLSLPGLKNWVYCRATKRFINMKTGIENDKEQFDDAYGMIQKKGRPSNTALRFQGVKQVDFPTYMPGGKKIIEEKDDDVSFVNLWLAPKITPVKGDPSIFFEMIDHILPDEREQTILKDFIGYMVKHPGKKIHWSILLQGTQGIGKSLLGRTIDALLGDHNVARPTNAQLHEKFTAWMKNSQCVVVEELMASGRLQLMNKLKDLITEPTVSIREMHRDTYKMPNCANFLLLTNYEDAIVIPDNDRRFCVVFSDAQPKSDGFYKRYVDFMQNRIGELVYYYQKEHKFADTFSPQGKAPWTASKDIIISQTKHPIEQTLTDYQEDQIWPLQGDLVAIDDVMHLLRAAGHRNVHSTTLVKHLKTMKWVSVGRHVIGGERKRLWLIRNVEFIQKNLDRGDKYAEIYESQEAKQKGKTEYGVFGKLS